MGSSKSDALSELQARVPGSIFVQFPPDYEANPSIGYGGKKRYPPVKKLCDACYPDGQELLGEDDIISFLKGVISMDAVRASSVQSSPASRTMVVERDEPAEAALDVIPAFPQP